MKTITAILFFILTAVVFGQQVDDKVILYQIIDSYENDSIDYAKIELSAFVKTKPTSIYKIIAIFYLAEIANDQENYKEAIILYNQVLKMNVQDSIDNNYKNNSAKELAEIYINKKEYKKAIKSLDLTNRRFPYRHFCGNAYAADNIFKTGLYSMCYIAQEKYKKAIDVLTPYMFSNGLADNSGLIKTLYETYLKVYTKDQIKNEFLNADNSLVIKKKKYKDEIYYRPLIRIFGRQVYVYVSTLAWYPSSNEITDEEWKQKTIETIKQSNIYKLSTEE